MDKIINTIRAIVMFTLLLFVLIFCFQNRQEVDIKFLSMQLTSLPLFIALIGILSTGLLIGFLAGMIKGSKAKRDAARVKAAENKRVESRTVNTERKKELDA